MKFKDICNLIKKRRKSLGINQESLAEITGVSLHTISNLESGKFNPSYEVIDKITDVLGMEIIVRVKRND